MRCIHAEGEITMCYLRNFQPAEKKHEDIVPYAAKQGMSIEEVEREKKRRDSVLEDSIR